MECLNQDTKIKVIESSAYAVNTDQSVQTATEPNLRPAIARLSLNVTNTCNLACKYCYANQGKYYTGGMLMNRDTALKAVNFAAKQFSFIGQVHFFGGEPTLNPDTIEVVCEYFIYLHKHGVLNYLPHFGLTTNGWAIDERIVNLMLKYNFSVTMSLDGPKEIHDYLRVRHNNLGTYDAIVENAKKLIEVGIIPEFECTYTAEHYKRGFDLVSLMDFFYDTFQCRVLHAPMVIVEPDSPLFISLETATKLYSDAIHYSIRNLNNNIPKTLSVAVRLLNSLANKTPIVYYCPAGRSAITINADGNIYACFMLMCGASYCIGNVNATVDLSQKQQVNKLLEEADKWKNPACQNCWAQSLCFGCLGEDLSREGPSVHRSTIVGESKICDFKRRIVEEFLVSVAGNYT